MVATTHQYDEKLVQIPSRNVLLDGNLVVPPNAQGIVVFAHGSGSSRHSRRNRYVARHLNDARLATLLMDLLTPGEEREDAITSHLRFDIPLLAHRLVDAIDWLGHLPDTQHLRVGTFGASTGGAAALIAAALRPETVHAVVSRGGRPDLAQDHLAQVRAPSLLIVGGWDEPVIILNQQAYDGLHHAKKKLEIIPKASHLFEEPGALEKVADLAANWFTQHLTPAQRT